MENNYELSKCYWGLWPQWLAVLTAMLLVGTIACANVPKGFWQARSELVGAGFGSGYQFGDSACFEFVISSYDILNPLISFGGHYVLSSDSIEFRIEHYDIVEFFSIDLDYVSNLSDTWGVEGGNNTRVFLPLPDSKKMSFKQSQDTIWIGGLDFHQTNETWP